MRGSGGATLPTDGGGAPKRTPLILLWAFSCLFWSLFTPPHRTFAARVLLFQPLWGARMYLQDATWVEDLALSLALHAVYGLYTGTWRLLTIDDIRRIDLTDPIIQIYIQIFALLGACGIISGGIVHRGRQLKTPERTPSHYMRIDEQLLPPLLIPSQTTHSRVFPQKHSFSYSYLFVGIPVGLQDRISDALSVDSGRRSWFHISSADYLARGGYAAGLGEKLKIYLHSQGVTDRDYAFAYLVTAPRFLGYSFNPVSFWYLYDSDTLLRYMILEVNNTFDERRMYLLKAHNTKHDSGIDLSPPADGSVSSTKQMVFTDTWEKDFHVSPFNSRKGSYNLHATDPFAAFQETGKVEIDNTIILRSSKESSKIVARVWSQGLPRDATKISTFELARFIAAWWWVGFVTFPRIVWQAQKLFFRKKLHVWYRPEVTEASIGRNYTDDERHLESIFRAFLESVMELVEKPLRLIYEAAHSDGTETAMYSPGYTYEEARQRTLTLKVLSPAFYSRFVHYAHAKEALDRECFATEEKNRTISVEQPELLPVFLEQMKAKPARDRRPESSLARLRWTWVRRLRCSPPAPSYPTNDMPSELYTIQDIRSFADSELDTFVRWQDEDAGTYRRIATKLFLAQRFAFGVPALVIAADWLVRASFVLATMYYCNHSDAVDVLRPRKVRTADMWTLGTTLVLANGLHLWNFAKG